MPRTNAEEKLTPPTPFGEKAPRKKITSRNIEKYSREMYFENISKVVEAAYPKLVEKIKDGNMKALEMGLQIANILKPVSGVSVVNQIYNKNDNQNLAAAQGNSGGEAPGGIVSFESILRRLEVKDGMNAALPAATGSVIDITPAKEAVSQ